MKQLYPIIVFVVLVVIQLTIIPFFTFGSFRPDLIGVFVGVYAFLNGRISGMLNGFATGLIFDLLSGGIIGLSSFSKTINGFAAGSFYAEDKKDGVSKLKIFLIIFLSVSLDSFFYTFFSGSVVSINLFELIIYHGILPGIYTTVLGSPVLLIIERIK